MNKKRKVIVADGVRLAEHSFVKIVLKDGQTGIGELLVVGPLYLVVALKQPSEENDPDAIRTILKGKWMYVNKGDISEMHQASDMWPATPDKYKGMLKTRVCRNFKSVSPVVFAET